MTHLREKTKQNNFYILSIVPNPWMKNYLEIKALTVSCVVAEQ